MELSYDPDEAVAAISRADRRLARIIERAGAYTHRPEKLQSPFHALLRAIVFQQLAGKAASTIHGRVVDLFPGKRGLTAAALVAMPEQKLRGAGLSQNKMLAVKDLAAKTLDGTVPGLAKLQKMGDQEIIERLTAVRGIGIWTVEMLLMFRLGRPDVLPCGDYGVRQGFKHVYRKDELPTPKELLAHGERWRPYRSVASWYLWRAVDLEKEKQKKSKLVLPN